MHSDIHKLTEKYNLITEESQKGNFDLDLSNLNEGLAYILFSQPTTVTIGAKSYKKIHREESDMDHTVMYKEITAEDRVSSGEILRLSLFGNYAKDPPVLFKKAALETFKGGSADQTRFHMFDIADNELNMSGRRSYKLNPIDHMKSTRYLVDMFSSIKLKQLPEHFLYGGSLYKKSRRNPGATMNVYGKHIRSLVEYISFAPGAAPSDVNNQVKQIILSQVDDEIRLRLGDHGDKVISEINVNLKYKHKRE